MDGLLVNVSTSGPTPLSFINQSTSEDDRVDENVTEYGLNTTDGGTSGMVRVPFSMPEIPDWVSVLYLSMLYLSILLGVPGNAVTVAAYARIKMKTSCDWYILILALTDLVSCVCRNPVYILEHYGVWPRYSNSDLCKFISWLSQTTVCVSIFIFALIAVDRYLKMCSSQRFSLTPRQSRNASLVLIAVNFVLASPSLYLFENNHRGVCLVGQETMRSLFVKVYYSVIFALFLIMMAAVVLCYLSIVHVVRQNRRVLSEASVPQINVQEDAATSSCPHSEQDHRQQPGQIMQVEPARSELNFEHKLVCPRPGLELKPNNWNPHLQHKESEQDSMATHSSIEVITLNPTCLSLPPKQANPLIKKEENIKRQTWFTEDRGLGYARAPAYQAKEQWENPVTGIDGWLARERGRLATEETRYDRRKIIGGILSNGDNPRCSPVLRPPSLGRRAEGKIIGLRYGANKGVETFDPHTAKTLPQQVLDEDCSHLEALFALEAQLKASKATPENSIKSLSTGDLRSYSHYTLKNELDRHFKNAEDFDRTPEAQTSQDSTRTKDQHPLAYVFDSVEIESEVERDRAMSKDSGISQQEPSESVSGSQRLPTIKPYSNISRNMNHSIIKLGLGRPGQTLAGGSPETSTSHNADLIQHTREGFQVVVGDVVGKGKQPVSRSVESTQKLSVIGGKLRARRVSAAEKAPTQKTKSGKGIDRKLSDGKIALDNEKDLKKRPSKITSSATPFSGSLKQRNLEVTSLRQQRNIRITALLFVITVVYILSWVPPYIAVVKGLFIGYSWPISVYELSMLTYGPSVYVINTFANPVIYAALSGTYRAHVVKLGAECKGIFQRVCAC